MRSLSRSPLLAGAALALVGCGSGTPGSPVNTAAPAAAPGDASATGFENPGGMWMPAQMASHAATLTRLGLELDPAQLAAPTSSLLQSIVSLGGCSASFVSPDGLIATN